MTLTRRDVENIAHLARLEITEAELPVYVGSLSAILAFVEQLSGAATEDVVPMAHPLEGQVQPLREDCRHGIGPARRLTRRTPPRWKPASISCRR